MPRSSVAGPTVKGIVRSVSIVRRSERSPPLVRETRKVTSSPANWELVLVGATTAVIASLAAMVVLTLSIVPGTPAKAIAKVKASALSLNVSLKMGDRDHDRRVGYGGARRYRHCAGGVATKYCTSSVGKVGHFGAYIWNDIVSKRIGRGQRVIAAYIRRNGEIPRYQITARDCATGALWLGFARLVGTFRACSPMQPGLVSTFGACSPMQPGLVSTFGACSPMQPGLVSTFGACSPMQPVQPVQPGVRREGNIPSLRRILRLRERPSTSTPLASE